ncbi:hypothetical protein HGA13_02380 [Nocardia speluncae]|uniref:DUF35 domain-containing protein n=2 Tax=Nocardia speluncae TaxID=419477 RepID=A0A846X906_9NOCA|nr:hypothetical protein [Nocardia speluncae]
MGEPIRAMDRASGDRPDCTEILLILRRCRECGRVFAPPIDRCVSCLSRRFGGVAVSGTGSIVSWRMMACPVRARAEPVLRTVAIVELDEGPWVYAAIEGDLPPTGGLRVPVRFERPAREDDFPVFVVGPARM